MLSPLLSLSKKTKKGGYTLIEILVSLTIVGLIFGLGFVGYREFARRQDLLSSIRNLQGNLRFTQELALAGKKPAGCSVLDGYNFKIISNTSYEIRALCDIVPLAEKIVPLPTGITISNLSPDLTPSNTILFKTLGAGMNMAVGSSTTITLTQTATGNTNSITVTAGGEIR